MFDGMGSAWVAYKYTKLKNYKLQQSFKSVVKSTSVLRRRRLRCPTHDVLRLLDPVTAGLGLKRDAVLPVKIGVSPQL